MRPLLMLSVLTSAASALATIRTVGPDAGYATPCDAIAAAQANDEIDVAPGTYTDSCSIGVAGLTLKGVGGRPIIDLSGTDHPASYKGIYVITSDGVTIENMELMGAHISDDNGANGAGIRHQGSNLTVRNCYIHDNQDGILGDGAITVEYTELYNNGMGNGCDIPGAGCTHNIYMSTSAPSVLFQYNYSHHIATDTPDKGHLFKSRSPVSYVLYNRFSGEDGFNSYELDFPSGGLAIVVGNIIEKGPMSGNGVSVTWGEENMLDPDGGVFIANNTFVSDTSGSVTFIKLAAGGTLTARDNIFVGTGTPSSTGTLSSDNWAGDPLFVNRAVYDYHLTMGSPVRGLGVAEGSANSFSLVPVFEYVHPLESVSRLSAHDLGAFEFGTPIDGGTSGAGGGAGGGSASTGGGTASAGGGTAGAGGGGSSAAGGGSASSGGGGGSVSSGGGGSAASGGGTVDAGAGGGAGTTQGSCGCNSGATSLLVALCLLRRRRR